MTNGKTTARVELSLVVDVTQPWSNDCTMGQVRQQAQDSALKTVQRMMKDTKEPVKLLVNTARVTMVAVEDDPL